MFSKLSFSIYGFAISALLLSAATAFGGGAGVYPLFAMDPSVRRMTGTVEAKLEVLKELGYAGLSTNDGSLEGLDRLTSAAKMREMKVYALYLASPLTTNGIELPDHFDRICSTLGEHGGLLWLYIPSDVYEPGAESGDAVAVPALRVATERAGRHGVKVALYHHRDYWVESFADAIRVAEAVDRPNFGVSFNLCHSLAAGEEEQIKHLLRLAAPRLFMVTLNGADAGVVNGGWDRLIRPIGQGTYNLAVLVNLLKELGYEGAVGFQAFGIGGDPVDVLRESIEAWSGCAR